MCGDCLHRYFDCRDADNDGWRITNSTGTGQITASVDEVDVTMDVGDALSTGTSYHIAVVFDRDGDLTIYKNGVSVKSGDISGDDMAITIALYLGRQSYSDVNDFTGSMTNIIIFNKVLTVTQIQQMYNKTK